jgi:hypothetical protein
MCSVLLTLVVLTNDVILSLQRNRKDFQNAFSELYDELHNDFVLKKFIIDKNCTPEEIADLMHRERPKPVVLTITSPDWNSNDITSAETIQHEVFTQRRPHRMALHPESCYMSGILPTGSLLNLLSLAENKTKHFFLLLPHLKRNLY